METDNNHQDVLGDVQGLKAELMSLLEQESLKLSQADEGKKQVIEARRAELRNLLCMVEMAEGLRERSTSFNAERIFGQVNLSLRQILTDPEFTGKHQFIIDTSY
ncbi:hypothetical protein KJ657_02175 [Patescibacteria group bacterium]|nr:hypothetical protein [Patescibacteria group bacterium]MBU1015875.1 hypothetical protein [Patescibacteria group bacterium]MBU1685376.1 hypothetical protein [Patescibacteria group bacterium]MBU1938465.1 hypothetical protein [Patescibacteria group bacterium]